MKKEKRNISIILNLTIICLGIIAITWMYLSTGEDKLIKSGISMLTLFTVDSNIILIISSLIVVIELSLKRNLSQFGFITKMAATNAVTTTFLVVVLYLGFVYGWNNMIGGPNFILHIINPSLALISFLFFEYRKINFNKTIYTLLPTFIYTIMMLILIIFYNVASPYPFLEVKTNPLSITIIVFIVLGICIYLTGISLYFINKKINKRNTNKE